MQYSTDLRGTGRNVCISEMRKEEALVPATRDEKLGKKILKKKRLFKNSQLFKALRKFLCVD